MQKLLILLVLGTSAAFGSTIRLVGLPFNTAYGTYNGFATATIDGTPDQSLICDDYSHTTYVPSGDMIFNLSTLTGFHPAEYARFVQPGDWSNTVTEYEEAAILVDGLNHTGAGSLLDLTADYQYALWHLFTPSVALPNATARTLLNEAALRVANGSAANQSLYGRLRIYTPMEPFASNQEFLGMVENPEPSPAILMFIGALVMSASVTLRRTLRKRLQVCPTTGSNPHASARGDHSSS